MSRLTAAILCALVLLAVWVGPAASLSCYQQPYVPGQTNQFGYGDPGNLPKQTCQGSSTSCFKFVCFGTTYYTARGCLSYDPAQPQQNCQILQDQCPNRQGTCYTCTGNNCNGAPSLRAASTGLVALAFGLCTLFLFNKQ